MSQYKSSKKYYYFYRFGFLVFGVIFCAVWFFLLISNSTIKINGNYEIAEFQNTWWFLIIVGILLTLHLLLSKKASYIEIDGKSINIQTCGRINKSDVDKVEFIKQIPNVKPPLYKLKMKDDNKTYLFVINNLYVEFSGFVKDYSSMSKYLKEKF
nr:hypothetical protein [Bacteroidota bacterium]